MTSRTGHRKWGRRALLGTGLLALLLTGACATRVTSGNAILSPEAVNLARPTRVLVTDFTVNPGAVRQDQAIGLRLQRAMGGSDEAEARSAIATEVQSAISDTVVAALGKAGLPAAHAPPGAVYRVGDVIVVGRVLRIDEGNRTRRLGIGFGAGKSIVEARAELYAVVPDGPPVLLQTYDGEADSGRKPGLAVGASMALAQSNVAMGTLTAVTNVGGEVRRTPVGKEAASFGNRLATDIGEYAAQRGWITAAAVPAWKR